MMQRTKIKISSAEKNDIKSISGIDALYIPEHWSEKAFLDALESSSDIIIKAVADDKIVGFLEASYVLDEVNINSIAVCENYRRMGIGEMLIDFLSGEVRSFAARIMLEVRSQNEGAIKLYKKMNFTEDGVRKNFYSNPSDNAILMTKIL